MSLKGIIRRGAGYARRRDRSRYYRPSPGYSDSHTPGCGGCILIILSPLWFIIGVGSVLNGVLGLFGVDDCHPGLLLVGVFVLGFGWLIYQNTFVPPATPIPTAKSAMLWKCYCNHCPQELEFRPRELGTEIQCPSCGLITMLYFKKVNN